VTIVIGIDIGMTGAVAAVGPAGAQVHDLPVTADGPARMKAVPGGKAVKQSLRLCGRGLRELLQRLVPAGETALVLFEDVKPRPMGNGNSHGNTMHSQGSLMRSRGIVEGVLDGLSWVEARAVTPQAWKRHFGLIGEAKGDSRARARALYPALAGELARVKDHNRAESLLIAHYGLKDLT
jgi:hypothetical protein